MNDEIEEYRVGRVTLRFPVSWFGSRELLQRFAHHCAITYEAMEHLIGKPYLNRRGEKHIVVGVDIRDASHAVHPPYSAYMAKSLLSNNAEIAFREHHRFDIGESAKSNSLYWVLLHEFGHAAQGWDRNIWGATASKKHLFWPAAIEGLADILGMYAADRYRLPIFWTPKKSSLSLVNAASLKRYDGEEIYPEGKTGQEGISLHGHTYASAMLDAIVKDLTIKRFASFHPLRRVMQRASLVKKTKPVTSDIELMERFFISYGEETQTNLAAYLEHWKFRTERIHAALRQYPMLPVEPKQASWFALHTYDQQKSSDEMQYMAFVEDAPITIWFSSEYTAYFAGQEKAILDRFADVHREIARETGMVMSMPICRHDAALAKDSYRIEVLGSNSYTGCLSPQKRMALAKDSILDRITGEIWREPVYGLKAKIIVPEQFDDARQLGAQCFDALSVVASHYGQILRDHSHLVFTREQFEKLVAGLRNRQRVLIEALCTSPIYPGAAYETIIILLREKFIFRNWVAVFCMMLEAAEYAQGALELAKAMRVKLIPLQIRWKGKRWKTVIKPDEVPLAMIEEMKVPRKA